MSLMDDDLEISIKWFSRAECFFVAINRKISKVILFYFILFYFILFYFKF